MNPFKLLWNLFQSANRVINMIDTTTKAAEHWVNASELVSKSQSTKWVASMDLPTAEQTKKAEDNGFAQ